MRQKLAATILAAVGLMTQIGITSAEVPTPLQNRDFKGPWSSVTNTQGKLCVADRHDHPIDFNSTWCSDFIGVEAVKHWQEQTGTRSVTKFMRVPLTGDIYDENHHESHYDSRSGSHHKFHHENHDRSHHESHHSHRQIVYKTIPYTATEPIYTTFSTKYHIQEIHFDSGKYIYNGKEVSPELKAFLSSLPNKNIWVELITTEGETWNYEIGKNTVKAWKQIYSNPIVLPEIH